MKQATLFLLLVALLASCDSDDDGGSSTSFVFDDITYNLIQGAPTIQYLTTPAPVPGVESAVTTVLAVTGIEGDVTNVTTGNVAFALYRSSASVPLTGTYRIVDTERDIDLESDSSSIAILTSEGRVCEGWGTQFQRLNPSQPQTTIWTNPSGTVDITVHDDNTISVRFDGTQFFAYTVTSLTPIDSADLQMNIRGLAMEN